MYGDRVLETSTSTGTGAITLSGVAPPGRQTFLARFGASSTPVAYCIEGINLDGSQTGQWEVGTGTFDGSTGLTRTTVLASSNSGSLVNFSAGPKNVFSTAPAAYLLPQGATTQVPFNDGGLPGANANFTYDKTTNTVTFGNVTGSALAMTIQPKAPTALENGGTLTLRGQDATAATRNGGGVTMIGGNGSTTGAPGNVSIRAPNSSTAGVSGVAGLYAATATATGISYSELASRVAPYTLAAGYLRLVRSTSVSDYLDAQVPGTMTFSAGALLTFVGGAFQCGAQAGVQFVAGQAGAGGTITFDGGVTLNPADSKGHITLTPSAGVGDLCDGATSFVNGGTAGAEDVAGNGGNVEITGGASNASGAAVSGNGGNVIVKPGTSASFANGYLDIRSALGSVIKIDDASGASRLGHFGVTPVVRQTVAANATDLATVIALANSLRTLIRNYGLAP